MKERRKFIDIWRGCYSLVIPTGACFLYMIVYYLTQTKILNFKYITDSQNFSAMLESTINFVSIIIGIFGFLLPILITSKNEFALIKYFTSNIDKKAFSFNLRMIIVSGLSTIFVSCMLFFFDIFSEWFKQIMILLWIWMLFYFMLSSYRFVSIFIRLFLEEKIEPQKEVASPLDATKVKNLKDKIKKGT